MVEFFFFFFFLGKYFISNFFFFLQFFNVFLKGNQGSHTLIQVSLKNAKKVAFSLKYSKKKKLEIQIILKKKKKFHHNFFTS